MYQFLHFETYARKSSKTKKSLTTVIQEFSRVEGNFPHVPNPQKPIVRYGVDPITANKIIEERASKAKDSVGRKLRTDAQVALCPVTSFPRKLMEENEEFYQAWVEENIKYYKNKYGEDRYLSCVEHLDENHPHLHHIITNFPSEKNGDFNISNICEPIRVREAIKGKGKGKGKEKALAYKSACRDLQDEYWKEVSCKFGLLRVGAGKKRLTQAQYRAAQHEALLLADAMLTSEQKEKVLARKETKLNQLEASVKVNAKVTINNKEALRVREALLNERDNTITEFENNHLSELDNINPDRFKNFYIKRVTELKNKVTNYTNLYKEYRTKFNELLVKFTNQENKLNKVEKENNELKTENLKLKTALQIYKGSDTLINKELEITHHIKLK
ncbi:plasmid recombination protein [Vibrio splendidus]|uniref:plasmid recombination protein n=1 Tax=Vibrio splendidus TaxID=29497 RepID=UPI001E350654|nr:plasmid recombination protein [Vibrio splendidus]MCC4787700.1 plasmid recombination protein [Vibrio splendidus]